MDHGQKPACSITPFAHAKPISSPIIGPICPILRNHFVISAFTCAPAEACLASSQPFIHESIYAFAPRHLVLGDWIFSGAWCLGIGASSREARPSILQNSVK